MKSSWDVYLEKQLRQPQVKKAFDEELSVLKIGMALARQRKRMGLTQDQVAKQIGTSAPQVCRTEHKPDHANIRTLMRYADAVGMTLDVRLIAKG
jgi:DNA-binding XRE family transcriptional regulator